MIATYLNELFGMLVEALPRIFLFGVPFLVAACGLAALLDT